MNSFNLKDIEKLFESSPDIEILHNSKNIRIENVATLDAASESDLTWIKSTDSEKVTQLIQSTESNTIVISKNSVVKDVLVKTGKTFIITSTPKFTFSKIVNHLFIESPKWGQIHASAQIHAEAQFNPDTVIIGANCSIGKVTIGNHTIIHSNVVLEDNVTIGNNNEIGSGTVIGGIGFGYSKSSDGENERFPHVGGVLIENNVEIGSNSCIDRGALGNTIVKNGVKIDNLVHIAHNVIIEENSFIIANAMIAGSVKIGKNCWVAPSANVLNGITLADETFVGIMSMINKNTEQKETYIGIPAISLTRLKEKK